MIDRAAFLRLIGQLEQMEGGQELLDFVFVQVDRARRGERAQALCALLALGRLLEAEQERHRGDGEPVR